MARSLNKRIQNVTSNRIYHTTQLFLLPNQVNNQCLLTKGAVFNESVT